MLITPTYEKTIFTTPLLNYTDFLTYVCKKCNFVQILSFCYILTKFTRRKKFYEQNFVNTTVEFYKIFNVYVRNLKFLVFGRYEYWDCIICINILNLFSFNYFDFLWEYFNVLQLKTKKFELFRMWILFIFLSTFLICRLLSQGFPHFVEMLFPESN